MKKTILCAQSILLSTTAFFTPGIAYAQSSVDTLLEEIVIIGTKKRQAENVQDVPLAVTAYGDAQLEALKVRDLESLSYSIPNVSFDDIGTSPGTANFSIRGIGINSSIPSIDPTVGVFVDGIYLGINAGVVFDIFDLESIEVLRGPQGILFGRNVTGGAVLINTKRPTNEFRADIKTAVDTGFRGTNPTYYLMGSVGGPISEAISARVAAYYSKDEGWHKRYLGGPTPNAIAPAVFGPALGALVAGPGLDEFRNFGEAETILVRPSIYFTPSEAFDMIVRYEHGEAEGDGPAAQNHTNGQGVSNPFFSAPRNSFQFSIDEEGFYDNSWDHVIVEANLDVGFGDGTITNVFGWRQYESRTRSDIDATPLFLFHADATTDQDQISNELRYNGRFMDWLDVTTGLYYFTQDIEYNEIRNILGGARFLNGGGVQDQKTYGVFAQFDIDLTETLTFNVGARYSYEKKDVVISNLLLNMTPCDVRLGTCSGDFVDNDSWSNFGPKIGLQWTPQDNLNLYAHWTRGFRSGGYNFRNTSAVFPTDVFDEEKVNSYEVGLKAQPGRATINGAIFINDINNMQRELNLSDPIAGVVQIIRNTANATIWGFEVEARYAVSDKLLIQGSMGHTNGDYDSVLFDISSDGNIDDEDLALKIPRLAPWTFGAGFVYTEEAGDWGQVNLRFNYFHRDRSFYTDNNDGVLNDFDSIDAAISLAMYDGKATLSLYGKNLLNDVQFGGDTQLPASLGGGTFSPLAKGRVVGLELKLATY